MWGGREEAEKVGERGTKNRKGGGKMGVRGRGRGIEVENERMRREERGGAATELGEGKKKGGYRGGEEVG